MNLSSRKIQIAGGSRLLDHKFRRKASRLLCLPTILIGCIINGGAAFFAPSSKPSLDSTTVPSSNQLASTRRRRRTSHLHASSPEEGSSSSGSASSPSSTAAFPPLLENPSKEENHTASSSFSKEPVTTRISPAVRFGPFGSGGTVVGYSKHEGVRGAFENNFAERLELGAQLVIYEKGEKIVDLYGFAPEQPRYNGETLQCVASSGKNTEAIAMAMLVDRGLVGYDDPVSKHWPEFGANGGKDRITIADAMQHAGGVPFVVATAADDGSWWSWWKNTIPITTEDVLAVEPMEQKICMAENYPPPPPNNDSNAPSSCCCYHAQTRGFIVNGILRRVDPAGRSLGRFLREEITDPLSEANNETVKFFCGIPKEEQSEHEFAGFTPSKYVFYTLFVQIVPALLGFNKQLAAFLGWFVRRDGLRAFVRAVALPTLSFEDYIDSPEGRAIEFPSCGMFANARSMALINAVAMLAGNGTSPGGVRLLSSETVEQSVGGVVIRTDSATGTTLGFTRGGYGSFRESFKEENSEELSNDLFHPDDKAAYGNFVGWGGVGGSLSLFDFEKNISFAYCTNGIGMDALWGIRTRRIELQNATAVSSSSE